MNKILVISESEDNQYKIDSIINCDVEYVLIDNVDYAIGYLYTSPVKSSIIMIDYDYVEKFVKLSIETGICLTNYKIFTDIGNQYHIVKYDSYVSYIAIPNDDLKLNLF